LVLYLRALVACVLGNVFHIDRLSDTGDGALTGCSGHVMNLVCKGIETLKRRWSKNTARVARFARARIETATGDRLQASQGRPPPASRGRGLKHRGAA
jgi:hypothetical protein